MIADNLVLGSIRVVDEFSVPALSRSSIHIPGISLSVSENDVILLKVPTEKLAHTVKQFGVREVDSCIIWEIPGVAQINALEFILKHSDCIHVDHFRIQCEVLKNDN